MCGIAAYAGDKPAAPFLYQALQRLQYRGYDSWGMAVVEPDGQVLQHKEVGAADQTLPMGKRWLDGTLGIAHTRWATHGKVCVENTHPVSGGQLYATATATTWVVHNGIIENHEELRSQLKAHGYVFQTETDTEVIAHLFDHLARKNLHQERIRDMRGSLLALTSLLKGSYAFALLSSHFPGWLMLSCQGSPLLISKEGCIASDSTALAGYAEHAYRMANGQMAIIGRRTHDRSIFTNDKKYISPYGELLRVTVPASPEESLGDYPHYMLKEIHEQPEVLRNTRSWVHHGLRKPPQVVLLGCGSSYNACLLSRKMFELFANVQTTVEYASEFSHRQLCHYPEHTKFIAVTQSGETKDTLLAMERVYLQRGREDLVLVTNAEHSSAADLAASKIYLNAGPERGVAATKTFTASYTALLELAVNWCEHRFSLDGGKSAVAEEMPGFVAKLLREDLQTSLVRILCDSFVNKVRTLAARLTDYQRVLYLGRGPNYAVAREGALKLKEVAYIHAEALPSAEMKHGPLALIDDGTVSVFLIPEDGYEKAKVLSNMEEVKSRGGAILAITDDRTSERAGQLANWELSHTCVCPMGQPILTTVVLQLLAYYAAVELKRDVDRPRNLAKSVTVE